MKQFYVLWKFIKYKRGDLLQIGWIKITARCKVKCEGIVSWHRKLYLCKERRSTILIHKMFQPFLKKGQRWIDLESQLWIIKIVAYGKAILKLCWRKAEAIIIFSFFWNHKFKSSENIQLLLKQRIFIQLSSAWFVASETFWIKNETFSSVFAISQFMF